MTSVRELLHQQKKDILRIAKESGARNVRVFGSVVRGEEHPESDVDFLVVMETGRNLFDLIHLEQELTALLRRKTQVVSEGGLNVHLRDSILQEATPL